jgi:hypothetical protein
VGDYSGVGGERFGAFRLVSCGAVVSDWFRCGS